MLHRTYNVTACVRLLRASAESSRGLYGTRYINRAVCARVVSPYSKMTFPLYTAIIAVVGRVLSQARSTSSRALEYPTDSGVTCSQ
jgi:hypothetical protein